MSYEFADRLIELRKKAGMSQEELAQRIGLSRQAISKWERAESSPDIGNLVVLAELYDVTLDELVKGSADIEEEIAAEAEEVADADDTTEAEAVIVTEPEAVVIEDAAAEPEIKATSDTTMPPPNPEQRVAWTTPAEPAAPSADPISGYSEPAAPSVNPFSTSDAAPYTTQPEYTAQPQYGAPTEYPPPPEYTATPEYTAQPEYTATPDYPLPPDGHIPPPYPVKKRKNPLLTFPYPVLCVVIFMILGFGFGWWHPGWVIFLTIPFYYWIANIITDDENTPF